MSSEVCPSCGKTYKRLKSHLPHCKAAARSETPPSKCDVTANQAKSSSRPAVALSESAAKSTRTLTVTASPRPSKSTKTSVISSLGTQTSSLSSVSPPPSTKKKKQKLSEQIKTANMLSPATVSLESPPSPPLLPTFSKPKKQSLRALIEAAKSTQVSKGSLEGTGSASEDLPSGLTPFVADPLSSTAEPETNTSTIKDDALPACLPTDTKPRASSKMKVSKTKKVAQSLPTARDTRREDFWVDDREVEDSSMNKMVLNSGNGHQAVITLQDVRATLGQANATRQSIWPSILSQIETTDYLSSKISPVRLPMGNKADVSCCLVTTKTLSDQLACTSSQHTELQSLRSKSLKSQQASFIPLQQTELTSPAAPLLSGQLSSPVGKATSPLHNISTTEVLKVTGLLTMSPSKFSSPLRVARAESLRADDGLKSQLKVGKQNNADDVTKGALTQRSLGQVRLRELPEWLTCRTPSHPKDVVDMMQRGWRWYYRRYIDVKKGGVGGLGMLLAGYCMLGYIWSYPHIKPDRWRKYH